MCVIVRKPKDVKVSIETLHKCWQSNKDGAGFMYAENGTLVFQKGLMSFKSFLTAYQKIQPTNKEVLIHFRFATHGAVANAQTHPFIVHKSIGVMHNGIINLEDEKVGYIPPEDDEDTEQYQCRKCKTIQEIEVFPVKCTKCKKTLYFSNVDEIIMDDVTKNDTPVLSEEEWLEAYNERDPKVENGVNDESDGIILTDDKLLDKQGSTKVDSIVTYGKRSYFSKVDDKPIEVESDTQKFCSQIMEKLPKGFLKQDAIYMLLSQFLIHNFSVVACMNEQGEVKMLGDMSSQYNEKGVWFSNSNWKLSKNKFFETNNHKTLSGGYMGNGVYSHPDYDSESYLNGSNWRDKWRDNDGGTNKHKSEHSDFHGV